MSNTAKPLAIVVGVDGSPSSTAAVEWAARDAELRNVGLTLVHIVAPLVAAGGPWPEIPAASAEYARWQEDESREILEQAGKIAREAVSSVESLRVVDEAFFAPIVPTLVELSDRAELIVVGCRGQGASARTLLGSVSTGLVHHAHCPVAVIHEEGAPPSAQAPVVVGIDGSPKSESATEIAFDEASRRGVELVALHAWSDMGALDFPRMNWAPIEWANIKTAEEEVLAERLSGWRERYPDVVVRKVVVCDRPAPRLLELAATAQLVVVGSHGRGGFPGMLLGSVGSAVVNAAEVPVIVARSG